MMLVRVALLVTTFLLAVSTVVISAEAKPLQPQQAAICVVGDVYNTGSLPCAGLVCYGQSQYAWQTCIGFNPPCTVVSCETASTGVALCVTGVYNNQQGPSAGCDGVACTGYSDEDWETCVGDCTTCDAPQAIAGQQVALCVYGDAYNTGGRPCQGGVCVGYTQGQWVDCYPRFPPCWACPPPPPTAKFL